MKFLGKRSDSLVLEGGLTYLQNNSENNKILLELLRTEQSNFCAYTEKCLQELDSAEVEHFDSSKKYNDDYYNYYAVLRAANLYKKDEKYKGASFFQNLFFQNIDAFNARIRYVVGGDYEEIDENDQEAIDFIDFLGFNDPSLYEQRSRHIKRLRTSFTAANWNTDQCLEYFREHREELSFITAIEIELSLDLSEFYTVA